MYDCKHYLHHDLGYSDTTFVLEGDLHFCPIGVNFPVLNLHVGLGDLGNAQVSQGSGLQSRAWLLTLLPKTPNKTQRLQARDTRGA